MHGACFQGTLLTTSMGTFGDKRKLWWKAFKWPKALASGQFGNIHKGHFCNKPSTLYESQEGVPWFWSMRAALHSSLEYMLSNCIWVNQAHLKQPWSFTVTVPLQYTHTNICGGKNYPTFVLIWWSCLGWICNVHLLNKNQPILYGRLVVDNNLVCMVSLHI